MIIYQVFLGFAVLMLILAAWIIFRLEYDKYNERVFYIFKNPKYNGDYSVRHRGGYIYTNTDYVSFDHGSGISYDKASCASHTTIQGSRDHIEKWTINVYNRPSSEYLIIEELKTKE